MNKKAFTLIELLVVVLIVGILAAIALPQYQKAVARSRLTGLMTIGKNVSDALDRVSLYNTTTDSSALDYLDLSFKDYQGNDCTEGTCRVSVSGKEYRLDPFLNYASIQRNNFTRFNSYTDPLFYYFHICNETSTTCGGYTFRLSCVSTYTPEVTVDSDLCFAIGKTMGGVCNSSSCYWN